jgi:hypothetical protein
MLLFHILQKNTLITVAYFSTTYHREHFRDWILSGAGAAPTSNVIMDAMLVLLMVGKVERLGCFYWHDVHTNFPWKFVNSFKSVGEGRGTTGMWTS